MLFSVMLVLHVYSPISNVWLLTDTVIPPDLEFYVLICFVIPLDFSKKELSESTERIILEVAHTSIL